MIRIKEKKGLTQKVIIGMVITIFVSWIIILFIRQFIDYRFFDRETCHRSAELRSMPSVLGDSAKQAIPLKCKTEDIKIDSEYEKEAEKEIADAMYDCWSMLGAGKFDFFTESTFKKFHVTPGESACIICSTIRFGEKTKKKFDEIDITDYLQNEEIPIQKITYVEYFSDERGRKFDPGYRLTPLDTNKEYIVMYMGMKGDSVKDLLITDAGIAIGSIFIGSGLKDAPGMGSITKFFASKGGAVAILGGFIVQEVFVIEREIASAMYCDGNTEGCNRVILAEYDKENLQKNCGRIESIP
jgi:hypothetical protein